LSLLKRLFNKPAPTGPIRPKACKAGLLAKAKLFRKCHMYIAEKQVITNRKIRVLLDRLGLTHKQ